MEVLFAIGFGVLLAVPTVLREIERRRERRAIERLLACANGEFRAYQSEMLKLNAATDKAMNERGASPKAVRQ